MTDAAANLRAIAVELRNVPRSGLIATAKAVKAIAVEEAQHAGVATMHLPRRGGTRRAVRLRAVDTIREREPGVTSLRVQGIPVGPWAWATTGTDAHLIGAGRTRGLRTSSAALKRARKRTPYLRFGADQVRRPPVLHPGVRGRYVWRRVTDRAEKVVPVLFTDAVRAACRG